MSKKKNSLIVLILLLMVLSLSSCRQEAPRPSFLPDPEPVRPPEMSWAVRTDYSGLTAYSPPHKKHTRMLDGPLLVLIPSQGYGMLLPYANATVLMDGSLRESKYGLVTAEGMIVTDLIYDRVDRADGRSYVYSAETPAPLPAYVLTVTIPGTENPWGGVEAKHAACALDGSWITPFDYADVVFTDDVIILMRSHETFDMDIYDYNGQFLYNALQKVWGADVAHDTWPGHMSYNISAEGYACLPSRSGEYFYVKVSTGKAIYTKYTAALPFSEGLAAVRAPVLYRDGQTEYNMDLWGFINTDFELVIQPQYTSAAAFLNGRAVVETPGGKMRMINRRGETAFTVPEGYWIELDYTGDGFSVHSMVENKPPVYYTDGFAVIEPPETALPYDEYIYISRLGGGWYTCRGRNGTVLFSFEEDYYFRHVSYISNKYGDIIIYSIDVAGESRMGVMTLDGDDIIRPEQGVWISAVTRDGVLTAFTVNTHSGYFFLYGGDKEYTQSAYRLFSADGGLITSGSGVLTYDDATGLYKLLSENYFAWLDMDGNTIISIPHMSNTMD